LPSTDQKPASRRQTTVRPNGQITYPASRNDAIPNGMVAISTHATRPAAA